MIGYRFVKVLQESLLLIQNWLEKKERSNDEDALYKKQNENMLWCDKNYLYLNVSKTKEMYIDFRKNQRCSK